MRILADLCVVPIGAETSVSVYVAECFRILEEAGLKPKLHAWGTNVEGEWQAVFEALETCHKAVHAMGAPRITTTVKIGTSTEITKTLDDKVASVKKKLASSSRARGNYTPEPTTSPWCKINQSGIHNNGGFAIKDIPMGTKIIEYVGERVSKKRSDDIYEESLEAHNEDASKGAVYLFTINKKFDLDGNVSWNTARYINHSCEPNCESDVIDNRVWIIATRDIKKGEELTYDYCYDIDDWETHPCLCGSPKCRGYIVEESLWPKLKRELKKAGKWEAVQKLREKNKKARAKSKKAK